MIKGFIGSDMLLELKFPNRLHQGWVDYYEAHETELQVSFFNKNSHILHSQVISHSITVVELSSSDYWVYEYEPKLMDIDRYRITREMDIEVTTDEYYLYDAVCSRIYSKEYFVGDKTMYNHVKDVRLILDLKKWFKEE